MLEFGEMSEWLKEHAWKACKREIVSWVRIPLPPIFSFNNLKQFTKISIPSKTA